MSDDILKERSRLLAELGRIHDEWIAEVQGSVELNWDHSNPHNQETGETDYNVHYPDRSASAEQEALYQERIRPVMEQLDKLIGLSPEIAPETGGGLKDKLSKVSTDTTFALTVNGDAVMALVKMEWEEGFMYYREAGEWVQIGPEDDLPAIDDADQVEVIGDAVEFFDSKQGQELRLTEFSEFTLDEI